MKSQIGDREYSAVLVKVDDSQQYKLIAPDNEVVESYSERPTKKKQTNALNDNNYITNHHIPFRNLLQGDKLPNGVSYP